jgi:hypothetical protein
MAATNLSKEPGLAARAISADDPARVNPASKETAAIRPSDEVSIFRVPFGDWQALSHFCDHYIKLIVIYRNLAKFLRLSTRDGLNAGVSTFATATVMSL